MAEPRTTFLVLINSRSGGQDGPQILERFRTLAVDGLLTDGLQGEVPPSLPLHPHHPRPPFQPLHLHPSPHHLPQVVSLTDPHPSGEGVVGPRGALEKYKGTRNLRVVGRWVGW